MRIGLICPPWVPVPPPSYGGTELVVDVLARGLQREGHQVLLAAAADSSCPVPMVPGTEKANFAELNGVKSHLSHVVIAYQAMRGVDIIHDHTLGGPLHRGRPPGIPVVTTNHGPFDAQTNTVFRALAQDTTTVAISANQASHAVGFQVDRVIHHGIEIAAVPVGAGDGGYAACLARMSPSKGIADAIRIARAADVPLRIAAKMREPNEIAYFEQEVRPLLSSEHEYLGEITEDEKYELLGGAFAMLNPIRWAEPFGLTMIESLATGTPVVGTPYGSAPEIIQSGITGYLARGEELARLLPLAAELDRAACRARAEDRFSSQRMVANHIALYNSLLNS